tara:strand:+ start:135 stop:347 length:213 start_codon:yes stop_codon:yes gene_type:complete
MKKGPFKMEYTNGKTADANAFPFKESPVKFMNIPQEVTAAWDKGELEKKEVEEDRTHTLQHKAGYITGDE